MRAPVLVALGIAFTGCRIVLVEGCGDGVAEPGELCLGEAAPLSLPVGESPFSVKLGDFDGDGDPDLLSLNIGSSLSLLRNSGGGLFGAAETASLGFLPISGDLGDLDGDGDPDLALAVGSDQGQNGVRVLRNDGTGRFNPEPLVVAERVPSLLALGDIDGDGDLDAVTASVRSVDNGQSVFFLGDLNLLRNDGAGNLSAPELLVEGAGTAVGLGDVDGDSDIDVVAASVDEDLVRIFLNAGDGQLGAPTAIPVGDGPRAILLADLSGDGLPEILTPNLNAGSLSLLVNVGGGSFALPVDAAVDRGIFAVEAGDLDGDGDLDLATANRDSDSLSLLLNAGDATLEAPRALAAPGTPFTTAIGDLDGDGAADLASANFGADAVGIFFAEP